MGPLECFGKKEPQKSTRETGKRKYFEVACQPLVTTPPPIYPWRTDRVGVKRTTTKPSTTSFSQESTTIKLPSPTNGYLTPSLNSSTGEKKRSDIMGKNVSQPNSPVSSLNNTSFLPVDPTGHTRGDISNGRKTSEKQSSWLLIVIVAGSSVLFILALAFLLVVVRHKRKNGVWCTGLFEYSSCRKPQQLPKIEIYRHSMGTDSPDILHMEDFKNTKVVDLQVYRGRFIPKKNTAKKMVTFKDGC